MIHKSKAIKSLVPDAIFSECEGVVDWQSPELTQPTEAEINAEITRLEVLEPMHLLRRERSRRLVVSDWSQGEDVPLPIKNSYKTYRQELRDITNTYTSLEDVVWPEKPE
tara:strand:- start:523 stop:852 length:330 start_codon:yes stop_codon:yes gene_type:complete